MAPRNPCRGLTALLSLSLSGLLSAAESPPATVIQLSPFRVSSEKDVGYLANNTLAGSRLRTNLAYVANAISVITPEFIADLNAFSENDLMRYSAAAVPERTDQTAAVQGINTETGVFQYRIRGQLASRSRNYFGSNLLPGTYNSERFEEARGPNAILFGLGGATRPRFFAAPGSGLAELPRGAQPAADLFAELSPEPVRRPAPRLKAA